VKRVASFSTGSEFVIDGRQTAGAIIWGLGIAGLPVSIVLRQVQPLAWIIHEDPRRRAPRLSSGHVQPTRCDSTGCRVTTPTESGSGPVRWIE